MKPKLLRGTVVLTACLFLIVAIAGTAAKAEDDRTPTGSPDQKTLLGPEVTPAPIFAATSGCVVISGFCTNSGGCGPKGQCSCSFKDGVCGCQCIAGPQVGATRTNLPPSCSSSGYDARAWLQALHLLPISSNSWPRGVEVLVGRSFENRSLYDATRGAGAQQDGGSASGARLRD